MKFLVINGSPKGEYSVTVQTMLFLQELYKEHEFKYVNVGQQIRKYEKDINCSFGLRNCNSRWL